MRDLELGEFKSNISSQAGFELISAHKICAKLVHQQSEDNAMGKKKNKGGKKKGNRREIKPKPERSRSRKSGGCVKIKKHFTLISAAVIQH